MQLHHSRSSVFSSFIRIAEVAFVSSIAALTTFAQVRPIARPQNRVLERVDVAKRTVLSGHVHPKATADNDQGRVNSSLELPYLTLILQPSAAQQSALQQLLAEQQDATSPNYHRWLTPEQYADQFGVTQSDISKVTAWLQSQGLNVVSVSRARNRIAFSGSAGNVENAFGTQIHNFLVNGNEHYANISDPTIPAAFQLVVHGVHGLNDFRMHPHIRTATMLSAGAVAKATGRNGATLYTSTATGDHYIAPDDISVLYNVAPLYSAGLNGTRQKIAIVGQSGINLADIQHYRSYFNLAASDPQVTLVPGSTDPGIVSGDVTEADLDIEISGAVARNAQIIYVYAKDVGDAAQYVIDNNLAPVMSMSYGSCEAQDYSADAMSTQQLAQQANAQGMTWIAASGDAGATDCEGQGSSSSSALSVDTPASTPEVTGIGGTEFNEGSGNYWNATGDANRASALAYIPEIAWNDSSPGNYSASGGGASVYFAKPSWQTGAGVPADNARDVPDISFSASSDHDGYMIYSKSKLEAVGGTSVGAPLFAGVIALLNQAASSNGQPAGQGNVNPRLYALAQSNPSVFHDVTSGSNISDVTCGARSRNCTAGSYGYSAGAGYDQATGLGSLDIAAFVNSWGSQKGSVTHGTVSMRLHASPASVTASDSTTVTVLVTAANNGTPSGTVTFSSGNSVFGTVSLAPASGGASASLTLNGSQLSAGTNTVYAAYSGDTVYAPATSSTVITLASGASGPISITGLTNGASYRQIYAPGMILSIFGSNLAAVTESAGSVPLPTHLAGTTVTINGAAAPFYYASSGQLNVQIPFETTVGARATLVVSANGQTATTTLPIALTAPGIFMNQAGAPVPTVSAARGQIATLYITGQGALSPSLPTGSAPSAGTPVGSLPQPALGVAVSVGGVHATTTFIGVPVGLVGVTQINYEVPTNSPVGAEPVVVTVNGVASVPATLNVMQ